MSNIYALVKKLHGPGRAEWDTAPIVDPTQVNAPMGQPPGGATPMGDTPSRAALASLTQAPPPEMNPETPFQGAQNIGGDAGAGASMEPDKMKSLMNRFKVARQNKTGGGFNGSL